MENNPKVSAVIPVYNKKRFLNQMLFSLSSQPYKNCEFILVDDCSTDGSDIICKKWASKDGRFIYIRNNKNCGAAETRNVGLKKACGYYICFLDADDVIENDFFSYLIKNGNGADILMCGASSIDENTNIIKTIKNLFEYDCLVSGIEIWKNFQWILCSAPWNKLFKRELINSKSVIFENIKGPEDLLFNYKIIDKDTSVFVTNNSLYKYRIVQDSLSRSFGFSEELNDIDVLLTINQSLIDEGVKTYTNIMKTILKKYFNITSFKKHNLELYQQSKYLIKTTKKRIKIQLRTIKIPLKTRAWIMRNRIKSVFVN